MEEKPVIQLKPKITPEQVKEKLKEKSIIGAEGEDRHKETEKLNREIQKAEKPKRQKKEKPEKITATAEFPVESRINNYGFIFMRKQWLAALGWAKGMRLKIHKNQDGSITIEKV